MRACVSTKANGRGNPGTRGRDKMSSIRQGPRVTATMSVDFEAVKLISVNKELLSEAEEVAIHSSSESASTPLASSYFLPF